MQPDGRTRLMALTNAIAEARHELLTTIVDAQNKLTELREAVREDRMEDARRGLAPLSLDWAMITPRLMRLERVLEQEKIIHVRVIDGVLAALGTEPTEDEADG